MGLAKLCVTLRVHERTFAYGNFLLPHELACQKPASRLSGLAQERRSSESSLSRGEAARARDPKREPARHFFQQMHLSHKIREFNRHMCGPGLTKRKYFVLVLPAAHPTLKERGGLLCHPTLVCLTTNK